MDPASHAARNVGAWTVLPVPVFPRFSSRFASSSIVPIFSQLPVPFSTLRNRLALRRLARKQERFDQPTFAANRPAGESLEPQTLGHLRSAVKPLRELFQLRRRNLPAPDAVEQVLKKGGRNVLASDSRHNVIARCPA